MKMIYTAVTILMASLFAAPAAYAFDGEVYRGAIQVGSTSIPALCAKSTRVGIQCFTTDVYSKGRVASDKIDNTAPVMDPAAATVWASAMFGEDFRPRFNADSTYAIIGGVKTETSHKHTRW